MLERSSSVTPRPIPPPGDGLERTLSLPLLVFYGLGVTVGAGIFALVGEILGLAGDQAPLAFLLAGVIAGFTGISYMALVSQFPRAGGEAIYVGRGLGRTAGRVAGYGVVTTGVISSAVVAKAFAGYVATLVDLPQNLTASALVIALCLIAAWGVRESVIVASIVTVLEVGTLLVVVAFGLPGVDANVIRASLDVSQAGSSSAILAGAGIAFFAFIGFEDIANMAEETKNPETAAPRAIRWTLAITVLAYVSLAVIAVSLPDRTSIVDSDAPMAVIFELASGRDSAPVATVASFAMVNGILVQIIMAARVLYGMAQDGQAPRSLGAVDSRRHTPTRATSLVGVAIIGLLLFFPLVSLARATSIVILAVFTLVNLSLIRLARTVPALQHTRWILNGTIGAVVSFALCAWQIVELF
jgi:amino acid transporter